MNVFLGSRRSLSVLPSLSHHFSAMVAGSGRPLASIAHLSPSRAYHWHPSTLRRWQVQCLPPIFAAQVWRPAIRSAISLAHSRRLAKRHASDSSRTLDAGLTCAVTHHLCGRLPQQIRIPIPPYTSSPMHRRHPYPHSDSATPDRPPTPLYPLGELRKPGRHLQPR